MVDHDVHVDEMDDLTPEELEYLLEHPDELDTHPVAVVFADLRSALQAVEAPAPGLALAEFLGSPTSSLTSVSNQDYGVSRAAAEGPFRRRSENAKRNRKARRSVAAIAATTAGKILLGATAAAAAFGAAHATGVVDLTSDQQTTEVIAASDASAATTADHDNEFQVDADGTGTLGVFVEDSQIRLADISSAPGWSGRLKADSDTEVLVVFGSDSDDDRQVGVRLTLAVLDPKRAESVDLTSFVTVEITSVDGDVRTLWFGNDGAPLSNIARLSELVLARNTGADLALDDIDLDAGLRVGTNDRAQLDTQAETSVNLGTSDGVDAGVQLDTDVKLELGTHTGTNPDLGIELGSDAEAQLDSNGLQVGANIQSNLGTGTGSGVDAGVGTNLDLGTGLDVDAGVSVDAGISVDTDLDVGADLDLDVDLDDGLDVDLDTDLDVGLGGGAGSGSGVGLGVDLDSGDLDADVELDLSLDGVLDTDTDINLGLGLGSLFGN